VAFPLAVAVITLVSVLWCLCGRRATVLPAFIRTLAIFALVASPWIVMISIKYHRFTFGTAPAINHSMLVPSSREPINIAFVTLYQPKQGRVTAWEDPSELPYKLWSPFSSKALAVYQFKILGRNALFMFGMLHRFDLFGLGLVSAIGAFIIAKPRHPNLVAERWRWILIPLVCLFGVYLPANSTEGLRFYWFSYPALFALSAGFGMWLVRHLTFPPEVSRRVLALVLTISFFAPIVEQLALYGSGSYLPSLRLASEIRQLASELRADGLAGPVAGCNGLYLAFFLEEPYLGDQPNATAADFCSLRGKARLLLVARDNPAIKELDTNPAFRDLSSQLPGTKAGAVPLPFKLYEVSSP
jgi:hypothetical protein